MDTSRWWNAETVAVVTGANKGIGFEVCKQLAEKGLKVILTARNESRGRASAATLEAQGLHNIVFHQLDVQDEQSVAAFASWLLKEQGGLDILINNAGVSGVIIDHEYIKENNVDPLDFFNNKENSKGLIINYESAKSCLDANYYGVQRVTKALLPLFRPSLGGARIVNMGSDYGQLCNLQSIELQQKLDDVDNLSEGCIDDVLDKYLDDVKSDCLEGKGWPVKFSCYKMSKVALHAYTRILARDLEQRPPAEMIFVNCVHPGFVRTDMNFHMGPIDPPKGAKNVVAVTLLPHQDFPSGKFFYETKVANF